MFRTSHPSAIKPRSLAFKALQPHFMCQRRGGFTLFEMMVVITIIAILASIAATGITSAKEKARQTDCMSNLRQLGTAIVTYRADNRGRNPPWLSALYPTYIDDKRVFVCRSDPNRGVGVLRADEPNKYTEVIDSDYRSRHSLQNKDVEANSYFYEFSAANCSWSKDVDYAEDIDGDGVIAWWELKERQLAIGNNKGPYSSSMLPIVRCYHHINRGKIHTRSGSRASITLNVAYAGNVVIAPLKWEEYVEPGRNQPK